MRASRGRAKTRALERLKFFPLRMKKLFFGAICLISLSMMTKETCFAASISPALSKAKQAAEAKGFIFATSKDEIIAEAKKEGRLEVLTFLDNEAKVAMIDAFRKKYPFIQVNAENIGGTDEYQRFILEMKAGGAKRWDTVHISNQVYAEYPPYLKKFDIQGMAEQGILNIPTQIVDYNNRNIVSKSTQVAVAAYNKKLLSADKVPTTWEGFLGTEFKGRKLVVDVRPLSVANLVPAWGLDKTLDFARKIAAQQPVWVRGSRTLASMATGEYAIYMGLNLGSVMEAQAKDPTKSLALQFLDPVPVRFGSADGVLNTAAHPYGGLLWIEFQVAPQGQEILDKYGPVDGSAYIAGSLQNKMIRGKTLSFLSWELQKKPRPMGKENYRGLRLPNGGKRKIKEDQQMPRIAHIAVKVEDLDEAAEFYEKVFGFVPKGKSRSEDRSRRGLTDGEIDLTFLKYDSEESAMAQAAGQGPCIHHFAIEVENLSQTVAKIREFGCEILSDPTKAPVKFRIPGGPIMEIVPQGRYQKRLEDRLA